jgi:hypothetical protein
MVDFSSLRLTDVDGMFNAIKDQVAGTATDWFNKNSTAVTGYLKQLAQAAVETQSALIQKRIPPEQAQMIMANQKAALEQTADFAQYMTLVLAQQLMDGIFSIIGWSIFNTTGVNLFPELVKPQGG